MAAHGDHEGDTEIVDLGPGQTVDTGDQLSSVMLLGIAVVGGAVSVFLNAVL